MPSTNNDALQQAELELKKAHEANLRRASGTVFGYDTHANLSGAQVAALLAELQELRGRR
jgi:hypothetical protein